MMFSTIDAVTGRLQTVVRSAIAIS